MNKYKKHAKELADFMRRLYQQKLTTTLGCNISMKVDDGILITPSQIDKYSLKAYDIIHLSMDKKDIKSLNNASIETRMHLAIYKVRSDVGAIIHAHPFWCTVASIWRLKVDTNLTDEAYYNIKNIAYAKYFPMGSKELANEVADKSKSSDVVMMANHGIVCMGKSLVKTFEKIEIIENLCHISWLKQFNDKITCLTDEAKNYINENY